MVIYSLVNLTIWLWWVLPLVRTPIDQINRLELTAAVALVCIASPVGLALLWHWLRTSVLHRWFRMDHPTPRGWDHFIRNNNHFWVLFHWKNGKVSGGYFGEYSYASTFPQEPEIYVEEMWRLDERGEFVEMVENTLGGVIRISECERVEFFKVEQGEVGDGLQKEGHERTGVAADRRQGGPCAGGANGSEAVPEQRAEAAEGRIVNGAANEPIKVNQGENTNGE